MKQKLQFKRHPAQLGLTLFELLVVLAILAFIATLVAPRVVGYLGRAKSDIARTQSSNIASSLELYFLDFGRYPTEANGLKALVDAPTNNAEWFGPYLKDEAGLTDPWGRPYLYTVSDGGDAFEVMTLGRDGETGGKGEDADYIRK